ncbi:alanyl-tRNA editing protein [Wenxinia marina]|uniref:Alanine--tRNA ligase n=1 Tax=Wenxinia marina DSM 24838 TaxID=1123501 RepID=A0A0D0Q4U0_9RHOB|nr:alanyl-tRNA editing protein [Wenxinia marina]KIQ69534.1 Ala-tRNA(Pro) hydrolase [Wenxinia marina DSM 24838]GGL59150.1 Ala-tRNA(Pro) hydrolase [Wenxinia marina]
MTETLFLTDPYAREAEGTVTALTAEGGLILDRSLFYATGGGQPGDSGAIAWDGGTARIATAVKADGGIALVPEEGADLPPVGACVTQRIDWDRRHGHMRVHTALHLLSVVIPLPVTGGAIGADKGRLDFAMPEPPEDVAALEEALNELAARDLPVTTEWITDAELDSNPGLVKTMSVQPPRGAGRVRLVRIGEGDATVDLQPCGGTHVARTGEIGPLRIGKVENKGKQNRRVALHLAS